MENKTILSLENLSIHFGGLKAVENVNLKINQGELYGLIGPNGAGKTTIFNLITGVYKPTNGKIIFNDENIAGKKEVYISRKGIARTFQNIRLFNNLSVIHNVLVAMNDLPEYKCSIASYIFRSPKSYKIERMMRDKAKELLKIMGLYEVRNELSCNLSYGKQRKLEIARALASKPSLLLLDEPAAGMNPEETSELTKTINLIREKFNLTILLIEHDMKLVSTICDKITVLNFGEVLVDGETKKVLNDKRVIKAYLGE